MEEIDLTTHWPSLGIALVHLLGGFQRMSSEPSGNFLSMPFPPGPLENALCKAVQLLSDEAPPPPAEYSIAAYISQHPSTCGYARGCETKFSLAVKTVSKLTNNKLARSCDVPLLLVQSIFPV